jgi:hypothetical protein
LPGSTYAINCMHKQIRAAFNRYGNLRATLELPAGTGIWMCDQVYYRNSPDWSPAIRILY